MGALPGRQAFIPLLPASWNTHTPGILHFSSTPEKHASKSERGCDLILSAATLVPCIPLALRREETTYFFFTTEKLLLWGDPVLGRTGIFSLPSIIWPTRIPFSQAFLHCLHRLPFPFPSPSQETLLSWEAQLPCPSPLPFLPLNSGDLPPRRSWRRAATFFII